MINAAANWISKRLSKIAHELHDDDDDDDDDAADDDDDAAAADDGKNKLFGVHAQVSFKTLFLKKLIEKNTLKNSLNLLS